MKNYLLRLLSGIKSRTVWTVIAIVILNGIPAAKDLLPQSWLPYLDVILGFLAVHFRVNPRANFDKQTIGGE